MLSIITLIGILLGIILIKYASKKQNKRLKKIGIFVITICLIYAIPSFLMGAVQGFIDGCNSGSFY